MKQVYLVLAAMMLLCLAPMPYGYYMLVRFVAMVVFGMIAYRYYPLSSKSGEPLADQLHRTGKQISQEKERYDRYLESKEQTFVGQFDDYMAKSYYVDGLRGEAKKIALPRSLVAWEY